MTHAMKPADPDETLDNLLLLHGEIFPMDNGYWTKFEAYRVDPSDQIPHGIRYSLTLHDNHNERVLGFDNAHGYKPRRKNMGRAGSPGITCIDETGQRLTNSSQPRGCWRIFGKKRTRSWRGRRGEDHEGQDVEGRHPIERGVP